MRLIRAGAAAGALQRCQASAHGTARMQCMAPAASGSGGCGPHLSCSSGPMSSGYSSPNSRHSKLMKSSSFIFSIKSSSNCKRRGGGRLLMIGGRRGQPPLGDVGWARGAACSGDRGAGTGSIVQSGQGRGQASRHGGARQQERQGLRGAPSRRRAAPALPPHLLKEKSPDHREDEAQALAGGEGRPHGAQSVLHPKMQRCRVGLPCSPQGAVCVLCSWGAILRQHVGRQAGRQTCPAPWEPGGLAAAP